MHHFLSAIATELRGHDLPAAQAAASLLDSLPAAPTPAAAAFVPPFLAEALHMPGQHPLTEDFAPLASCFPWIEVSPLPMAASVSGRYSYCQIAGPGARIDSSEIVFGAFLQFPDTWYPYHWHAAEELYFVLSGTAAWFRDGIVQDPTPPGTLIRHAPHERHAMRTGSEPLLALWFWLGDLDAASYGTDPN